MHPTAMDNALRFRNSYLPDISNLEIAEIGSQNVNGSIKDHFKEAKKYIGIDFCAAKGVDLILDDPYKIPLEDESVDVVLSSSVFEHSEFFWLLFLEIIRILKPGGLFYLNAPSNGTFHRYPVDCWRFYPDSGNALKNWAVRNNFSVDLLESYTSNQDRDCWNDFVAVFYKKNSVSCPYKNRIISSFSKMQNALIDKNEKFINESRLTQDQLYINEYKAEIKKLKAISKEPRALPAIPQTPLILRAHLDSPKNISFGNQIVKGWVICTTSLSKANVIFREDGVTKLLPLNMKRPDVISKLLNQDPTNHENLKCGFEYQSKTYFSLEIGIEISGSIFWFKNSTDKK